METTKSGPEQPNRTPEDWVLVAENFGEECRRIWRSTETY